MSVPLRQVGAAVCSGASLLAYKMKAHISNMFYNVLISQYTFTYVSSFFRYVGRNIYGWETFHRITLVLHSTVSSWLQTICDTSVRRKKHARCDTCVQVILYFLCCFKRQIFYLTS